MYVCGNYYALVCCNTACTDRFTFKIACTACTDFDESDEPLKSLVAVIRINKNKWIKSLARDFNREEV